MFLAGELGMNIRKLCSISLIITSFLTGCSYESGKINDESIVRLFNNQESVGEEDTYASKDSPIGETLAAKGIAIPQSKTSIYVNRLGYNLDDEKKAIFDSDNLGDSFNVINADNGHLEYVGKITGDDIKTGDFSQVNKAGKYYIETDIIGRSYYFTISDNADTELFINMLNNFYTDGDVIEETPESIKDACFGMDAVIYAMQCNGEAFKADNHVVEELLRMSDELISMQGENGSMLDDYEATAAFCGIISMCSNEFGKYEADMDKNYKDSAINAWKWLSNINCETDAQKVARFYAASQLFGLLNENEYKSIAEQYLNEVKSNDYSFDNFSFYGIIAYMSSKGDVDKELCTSIMMKMLSKADSIANDALDDKVYKVGADDIDDVMTNTVQICFFDYLVPSREYTDLLSNTIEYIGGYNPSGINYMENTNDKNFEYKGIMLFAISNILTED
jgi:hypothetical protein